MLIIDAGGLQIHPNLLNNNAGGLQNANPPEMKWCITNAWVIRQRFSPDAFGEACREGHGR